MRFKLLRRRLTISAPKMAIRSTLPWPVRWLAAAVLLGFCAALALWAFEFGREISGYDKSAKVELPQLRADVARLTLERDKAQSVANTSGSLLATEQSTQQRLIERVKQLEAENRELRDDLGFFEKLLPSQKVDGVSIRGLQAQVVAGNQVRWQVLVMQPSKKVEEFRGHLDLALAGTRAGKPWSLNAHEVAKNLQIQQYRRVEGLLDIPPEVVLKSVSVKLMDGETVKASQSVRL